MPTTFETRQALKEAEARAVNRWTQPGPNSFAKELPLNTALWFILSGMLVTFTAVAAVCTGLGSLVTLSMAGLVAISFVVGSLSWPGYLGNLADDGTEIQPFEEDVDWVEVDRILNIVGWLMVSGASLGILTVAFAISGCWCTGLLGFKIGAAVCSVVGDLTAAGIWHVRVSSVMQAALSSPVATGRS